MELSSMTEEIKSHRLLVHADTDELTPHMDNFRPKDLIAEVIRDLGFNALSCGLNLAMNPDVSTKIIKSDPVILRRVLLNLIKNNLEASIEDERVSLSCFETSGGITISVQNHRYIPIDVQHLIFQRSYSTKGVGSRTGTYSEKLFIEEYLQGQVWFESAGETGTIFYLHLPLDLN